MGKMDGYDLKLGKTVHHADELDPVPREASRDGATERPAMFGYDEWNAFEVSRFDPTGKPVVRHMRAVYDCTSPNIVESKSFKLFLNARNGETFESDEAFGALISSKLTDCVGGPVKLHFFGPEQSPAPTRPEGESIDTLTPSRISEDGLPRTTAQEAATPFAFHSHLLRSLCPVTGQPDWGTVVVTGTGLRRPEPQSLLAYVVAFRESQDFHETCCERIYLDLMRALQPQRLRVLCRYTRRGGLDINPVRAMHAEDLPDPFKARPFWRQ